MRVYMFRKGLTSGASEMRKEDVIFALDGNGLNGLMIVEEVSTLLDKLSVFGIKSVTVCYNDFESTDLTVLDFE